MAATSRTALLGIIFFIYLLPDAFLWLTTPGQKKHEDIWLTMDASSFFISVQGCSDVFVGLASAPLDPGSVLLEVQIDPDGNPSRIVDVLANQTVAEDPDMESVLLCKEYANLWIAWNDTSLWFGKGKEIGQNSLLEYSTEYISVTSLSLTSGGQDAVIPANWSFPRDAGRLLTARDHDTFWLSNPTDHYCTFQVRYCQNATVFLVEEDGSQHKVVIGGRNNNATLIETASGDTHSADTPGILSCDHLQHFWISWLSDHIEVGRGHQWGQQRLLHAAVPDLSATIAAVGFGGASSGSSVGLWQMRQHKEATHDLHAGYDPNFEDLILTTQHPYVAFRLKTEESGLVALSASQDGLSKNAVHIVISNVDSQIRLLHNGNITGTETAPTDGILSQHSYRPFYITWDKQSIVLGAGSFLDGSVLLEYDADNQTDIQALSFSAENDGASTSWQIHKDMAQSLGVASSGDHHYNGPGSRLWLDVSSLSAVVFKVRACQDAYLLLSEYHTIADYHAYEIGLQPLGEKTAVLRILPDDTIVAMGDLPTELGCDRPIQMWVSWDVWANGSLSLSIGYGSMPGEETFLEYDDNNPHEINSLSFTTSDRTPGHWLFTGTEESIYAIRTIPTHDFRVVEFATHWTFFKFSVMAASNVYLKLYRTAGHFDEDSFEITLGDDQGMSHITTSEGEGVSAETPNLLNSVEYRQFWILWDSTGLSVGKGRNFVDVFLSLATIQQPDIHFVSTATGAGITGLWKVPREGHSVAMFRTDEVEDTGQFETVWLTTLTADNLVFKVKSCYHASLALSAFPGLSRQLTYTVAIGTEANSKTQIDWRIGDPNSRVSISSPDILDCDEFQDFWVSWRDDVVRVGRGRLVGEDEVLMHEGGADLQPHNVHAVSLATSEGASGYWQIANYQDDLYVIQSPIAEFGLVQIHTRSHTFNFQLMACDGARIALYSGQHQYEVLIGHDDNLYTVVLKQGEEVSRQQTPGVLNCREMRSFWMTWQDDNMRVGTGSAHGRMLLEYWDTEEDVSLENIHTVSLATTGTSKGEWRVLVSTGNSTDVQTLSNDRPEYSSFWQTLSGRSYVLFDVKVCDGVHIALGDIPGVTSWHTYEIVLRNGFQAIRRHVNGSDEARSKWDSILSCTVTKSFWVHWDRQGWLSVGKGTMVGDDELLKHKHAALYPINAFSVSTVGHDGHWSFGGDEGNRCHVTTGHSQWEERYRRMWLAPKRALFIFDVKSCKDVRLALSLTPGEYDSNTYEIVIGTKGDITATLNHIDSDGNSQVESEAELHNLLHCQEFRPFWVSWESLRIEVGSGQPGKGRFLSSQTTIPHHLNAVSISTGNDSVGQWSFMQAEDESLFYHSNGRFHYLDFSLTVPHRTVLTFNVRTCRNAHLLLAGIYGNDHHQAYEITIGYKNNTASYIKEEIGTSLKHEVSTPGILSCNESRTYWLSWYQGAIKVGEGANPDQNVFMNWTDPEPHPVVEVFVNTGDNSPGLWEFLSFNGNGYRIQTYNEQGTNNFWGQAKEDKVDFRLKASSDAVIGLASEVNGQLEYEIVLGSNENQEVQILKEGAIVETGTYIDVLSEDTMRSFWASWADGLIEIGTGAPGTNRLLHYDDTDPVSVRALSLATRSDVPAQWSMKSLQDYDIFYKTSMSGTYDQFWETIMGHSELVFGVRAKRNAHIILAALPGIYTTLAYEIRLGSDSNQRSQITRKHGILNEDWETPDILSDDEFRIFWISWTAASSETVLKLGRGAVVGVGVMRTVHDEENSFTVNAYSVTSELGVNADWHFSTDFMATSTTDASTSQRTTATTSVTVNDVNSSTSAFITETVDYSTTNAITTDSQDVGPPSGGGGGLSAGEIVGIVFGSLVAVAILGLLGLLLYRYWSSRTYRQFYDDDEQVAANIDNPMYGSGEPVDDDSITSHFDNPFTPSTYSNEELSASIGSAGSTGPD